ncbi:MAG: LamG-like jellyroll fold domain-containing protein [Planctomycetota bacterium]
MCKKLILLTSFVLVLALVGTNAAFGALTIDVRVAATNNDAEEGAASGGIVLDSSDLELGYEGTASPDSLQIIGVRFTGVDVPKGVAIKKAWVQFTADDVDNDYHSPPVSLIVEGELNPNPVEFSETTGDISSRATTMASVVWDIPVWGALRAAGPPERTGNISSVIQEIIDQDDWAAGNAMVIILRDNPDNPSEGTREAEAFDGDSSMAPLLHIEYAVNTATDPDPADGGTGGPAPLMQWTKGNTAVYHNVYFGTNPDLGDADYMDRMPFAMYWHVPGLTPGTTYYWRIDEVEADGTTIHTGDLWSFTAVGFAAHSPDPSDGSRNALSDSILSWGAGSSAASHDVYFGTSRADVAAGTGDTFKGNQLDETYVPEGLQDGSTYFWKIDEVEADGTTRHPGEVWSFKTRDDPALIGWWKFDEGQGSIAFDSSGYGNHGILGGNPQWVGGVIDGGLELDGSDDYVSIDSIAPMMTSNNFSCSIWIKTDTEVDDHVVFGSNSGSSHNFLFGVNNGNVWTDDDTDMEFPPKVANNQWHMITYVREGLTSWIYVDGVLRKEDPADDEPAMDMQWSIGMEWDSSPSDEFEGVVDDARFWIRPLSAEEVAEVFKGDVELANNPKPAYGSIQDIKSAVPLSWSPGEKAAQHDVYFGTDELSVESADASDTTNIYRGRQDAANYTPSEGVEWGGGPYYWRIDEYNTDGTISQGKVWNFTVADYLIVDDMESYNDLNPDDPDSNRIYNTWLDGYKDPANGSQVGHLDPPFYEQTIVNSGNKSMPLLYDNSVGLSETTMTLTSLRNWTEEGVGVLTIWFRGEAANAAETLYVALNGNAVVTHENPDAAQLGTWTQWNIDLARFADQGVNLTNVNTISLGLGNKSNPLAGGTGIMYFDDIRLYRPAP